MKQDDWFTRPPADDSVFTNPAVLLLIGVLMILLGASCTQKDDAPAAPGSLPRSAIEALQTAPKVVGQLDSTSMYMVWCAERDRGCAIQQFSDETQGRIALDRKIDRSDYKVEFVRNTETAGGSTVFYRFLKQRGNLQSEAIDSDFHGRLALSDDKPVELKYEDVRIFFVSAKAYESQRAPSDTNAR